MTLTIHSLIINKHQAGSSRFQYRRLIVHAVVDMIYGLTDVAKRKVGINISLLIISTELWTVPLIIQYNVDFFQANRLEETGSQVTIDFNLVFRSSFTLVIVPGWRYINDQ